MWSEWAGGKRESAVGMKAPTQKEEKIQRSAHLNAQHLSDGILVTLHLLMSPACSRSEVSLQDVTRTTRVGVQVEVIWLLDDSSARSFRHISVRGDLSENPGLTWRSCRSAFYKSISVPPS